MKRWSHVTLSVVTGLAGPAMAACVSGGLPAQNQGNPDGSTSSGGDGGGSSSGASAGVGSGSVSTGAGSGAVSTGVGSGSISTEAGSGAAATGSSGAAATGSSGAAATGSSGAAAGSSGAAAGSSGAAAGSSGTISRGGTSGTSADASANDATTDGSMTTGYDGGLGPSCIKALFSTYVLRADGVLIWENYASSPETILDASTGLPLTGILDVQEGPYHGCAALSGGGAACWQTNATNGNAKGQLGNGTTMANSVLYRATPVLTAPATPLSNVVAIVPGIYSNNACAITSDGKLSCWGDLTWLVNKGTSLVTGYAQAITTDGTTPLAGVLSAALGSSEACAILSGMPNSVWCWGGNGSGQLGQGDTTNRQYPTKVLGLTSPTKLATAYDGGSVYGDTVCALDGSNVRCWGNNYGGTLFQYGGGPFAGAAGTNTTTNPVLNPTAVVVQSGTLLGSVADVQGGDAAFAVLRTDGTIWTWGYGSAGYAANYGLTNVLAIGWAGPSASNGPRYLTSDGIYHNAMTNLTVNCNAM
jgi:hypothetical protein